MSTMTVSSFAQNGRGFELQAMKAGLGGRLAHLVVVGREFGLHLLYHIKLS